MRGLGVPANAVGKSHEGVAVLDLWSRIMERAGWSKVQPLPGALEEPQSPVLKELLHDGPDAPCSLSYAAGRY